jgi:hypothetical protein
MACSTQHSPPSPHLTLAALLYTRNMHRNYLGPSHARLFLVKRYHFLTCEYNYLTSENDGCTLWA